MAIPHELDIDFSDIAYEVRLEEGFHILIVDGVPVIDKSKLDRLLAKLAKEFTRKSAATKYAFIEFRNVDTVTDALNELNGHPFNAKHIFLINRFTDIEKFASVSPTFPCNVENSSDKMPREHLRAWLADPQGRDQYVTYRGDDVSIHWHGRPSQCEVAFEDNLQACFFHPFVRLIDFSSCEQYLVTWSHEPIVTGHLLRTFPSILPEGDGAKKQMAWPALKWSPDDKYTAWLTPGQQISVYELPGMSLQGKKSLKIEGVVDFEWCPHGEKEREDATKASKKPTENMLAYWRPKFANQPARVTLLDFPGRTVLRQKNLFNVSEQNQRDFLCVHVDRHTKTKKSIFCNLEVFHVREKDFPVEVVELKDTVTDFSWEPKGERFAIVSSSDPNLGNPGPIKTVVGFYQLDRNENDFQLLRTLGGRTTNTIRWSPRRRHVVLATVGSMSKSELEFWDLDFNSDDVVKKDPPKEEWNSGIQQLGVADHYGVTDVEWDPNWRYLATAASAWTHKVQQFLWRPRAPSLLAKEQKRTIRRNLKEYARAFDEADAAEETSVSAELVAQRKRGRLECVVRAGRGGYCGRPGHEPRVPARKEKAEEEEDKEEIEVWIDEVIEQFEEVVE
ncbi:eukaryotic translation initiation factor eIF2A-domain-containing protein [Lactarius deliciosus]|nr:eukaryotic translation initiation factor eIF2A-domain-containing protein [Lactarius deliciosus]